MGAGIGLVVAIVGYFLYRTGYNSGFNSVNGMKGQAARNDRKTQENLAMLRIKELHDQKMPPLKIAAQIVVEYPDVCWQALRNAQKMAKEMGMIEEES